jgi:predicted RNA binding protein YcfA (HicA-like mRNA interferase family)
MPKLPSLTPEKVIRILERKGFILDRVKGSHHIYYNPVTKKRVIVPLHKRELPKGTLLEILRQADISRDEFAELL